MRNVLIAIAMASTAIGGAAIAQTGAPPAGQMPMPPHGGMRGMGGMMAADTNHDGVITKDEAIAASDRRFDEIDANHDGKITSDEMMAYRDRMMARRGGGDNASPPPPPGGAKHMPGMGRRADPNGDGVITRDEYRARAIERFDRMDANHDGKIDRTEMANLREMRRVDRRENQAGQTPPPAQQQ